MVGVTVLEMTGVGEAVGVLVEVGVGLGVLVFVGEMIRVAVNGVTFAMATGWGEFDRMTPTLMLRIKMAVPMSNQRRARCNASVRMK